jgi:hypothetical protein
MSDRWQHVVCIDCWHTQLGNYRRDPVRMRENAPEPCCFCGVEVARPIHVRHDPEDTRLRCTHREVTE